MSTVDEMAGVPLPGAAGSGGPEEDFERCFREVDIDGSGTISKGEMLGFLKKVASI